MRREGGAGFWSCSLLSGSLGPTALLCALQGGTPEGPPPCLVAPRLPRKVVLVQAVEGLRARAWPGRLAHKPQPAVGGPAVLTVNSSLPCPQALPRPQSGRLKSLLLFPETGLQAPGSSSALQSRGLKLGTSRSKSK